ncbi:hypothetical protein EV13_1273 [Prochlorococcus sp. MIT 0702]|nr:hypothetical protein EV12_2075 [Prochlorococcus sp. MIT 0701]KGG29119.1 hypothetical protein EV13_1273 [Prochlorococcus sp. MIT 0702]KGG32564.1 hypothetical protein EV14_2060 [Prochlorococcus sp. MIT 0703]
MLLILSNYTANARLDKNRRCLIKNSTWLPIFFKQVLTLIEKINSKE